jgi:hypothetical protein
VVEDSTCLRPCGHWKRQNKKKKKKKKKKKRAVIAESV